jgi:hypothetical protein
MAAADWLHLPACHIKQENFFIDLNNSSASVSQSA